MVLYAPLPSDTSTRLVSLRSGDHGDKIEVTVEVVDLAEHHPAYEAVSYTWSTDRDQQEIVLNDQRHMIRRNLYNCLLRLRSPSSPRLLWIDFLSISQNELREKSRQVQMIGFIFQEAQRVLAWVGEHADGSENLFRGMVPVGVVTTAPPRSFADERKLTELRKRAAIWTAFFARRYFTRLWVVQEIGNAKAIRVHCGNDSMSWTDLISCHMGSSSAYDPEKFFFEFDHVQMRLDNEDVYPATVLTVSWTNVHALDYLWNRERLLILPDTDVRHPFHTIMGLIEHFAGWDCSVPRDRIYALRSLEVRLPGERDIPVDYEMSISEVFVMLCRYRVVESLRALRFETSWVYRGIEALKMNQSECQTTLDIVQKIHDEETEDSNKFQWLQVVAALEFCLLVWDPTAPMLGWGAGSDPWQWRSNGP